MDMPRFAHVKSTQLRELINTEEWWELVSAVQLNVMLLFEQYVRGLRSRGYCEPMQHACKYYLQVSVQFRASAPKGEHR